MPDNTFYETDDEEFYPYASPNYLGASGITANCVEAMAAILTSTFRPSKITMVSLRLLEYDHDRVAFFVWDWPSSPGGTIVPDGFGTHGGEGGRGLSEALGLIRFYGIPLEQVVMYDREMFRQFAEEGKLTPQMFTELQEANPYNWNYYDVEEMRLVKQGHEHFLQSRHWSFRLVAPGNIHPSQ